jgi:hypothetical protein
MQAQAHPLIKSDGYYVMVSHNELNGLVARLMHLAELDSDKTHREAVKGELKQVARNWLDDLYDDAGYRNYDVLPDAKVVDVSKA